jgi:hypothetical protein
MTGELLIQTFETQAYKKFVESVFYVLGVKIKETRYSDNYANGEYTYGEALGLRVKVTEADDSGLPDYQYSLSFKPIGASVDYHKLGDFMDIVASFLAGQGWKIARPLEGTVGSPAAIYEGTSVTIVHPAKTG